MGAEVEHAGLTGGGSFQRGGELRQLAEALDSTELGFGGEHACGGPAQRHLAGGPALHAAGVVADDLDHRLDRVGAVHGLQQRPADAEPVDGEGLLEPLAQRRGGAG